MTDKSQFLKWLTLQFSKKIVLIYIFGIVQFTPAFSQLPTAQEMASQMTIGWNIGNSLEVPTGETGWGNPKINKQLLDGVADAGFNTIRIPCAWDSHADQTTLEIDEDYLNRVADVVDNCIANDMYVIINCHWDGGWLENNVTPAQQEAVNEKQEAYWTQIAEYFEPWDEYLMFAGTNEPNVENATQMAVLMTYHQTFVDAVRATGGNNSSRVLIIQGPSTDIDKTNQLMSGMPTDTIEDRLMAEIHFYTPWNFCGLEQDANWGNAFYYWGQGNHSTTDTAHNPTWGEESAIDAYLRSMKTKFVDNGIPVIMGEYGAIHRSSLTGDALALHNTSREYYFEYVTEAAIRNGMIPYYWDNGHTGNNGFGIFNRTNGEIADQGAVDAIMHGVAASTTGVSDHQKPRRDTAIELLTTMPNPVVDHVDIQLYLKKAAQVELSIVNTRGQEVTQFSTLDLRPGENTISWYAAAIPSGVYILKATVDQRILTRKIMVLH